MNTMELVHYVSTGEWPGPAVASNSNASSYHELAAPVRIAILRARQYLFSERRGDGSWLGAAVGDVSSTSQLVFLLAYLGEATSDLAEQLARTLLDQQLRGGGWACAPDGPADVSASVQAYFAVKLTGLNPSDQRLSAARDTIRKLGGADATDAATRFFLALLGQIDYDCCPIIAPETIFFGKSKRRKFAARSVLWALRPVRNVGVDRGVRELFIKKPRGWSISAPPQLAKRAISSRLTASILGRCEVWGWTPFRRRALDRVEQTLLQLATPNHDRRRNRLNASELILTMIALDTLGYGSGSKPFDACERGLNELVVVEELAERAWVQFRTEPLADTVLAVHAMSASGLPLGQIIGASGSASLARSTSLDTCHSVLETAWLLEVCNSAAHDSNALAGSLPPSIQVGGVKSASSPRIRTTVLQRRAQVLAENYRLQLLQAQNRDGGWAPAPGHESSSSPDVTGAVLQALMRCDRRPAHDVLERAITYLRSTQKPDGSWTSMTGVRLVHGTSLAICGLLAAGVSSEDEAVEFGINWLAVHQQASGGWGESPVSSPGNPDADFVAARATATQTSWALLALLAANRTLAEPARRAVQFLLDTQEDDGRWYERHFVLRDASTGRCYRNELQSVTWPLMALSRWAVAASAAESIEPNRQTLRLVGVSDI